VGLMEDLSRDPPSSPLLLLVQVQWARARMGMRARLTA